MLDKFVALTMALDGQSGKDKDVKKTPEFAAKEALYQIAHNHNQFSSADDLVREYARLVSGADQDLSLRLEKVLNLPIAIKQEKATKDFDSSK